MEISNSHTDTSKGIKVMVSLFKRKRYIRLSMNERTLLNYLEVIKLLSAEDIARGLDMAAQIKSSSLKFEDAYTDYWCAFNKPILVNEKKAERIQGHWINQMTEMHEAESAEAKLYASGMSIWSHSLLSAAYPELRQQGLVLWNELQRGFKYCKQFDPQKDVPEVF